MRRLAGFGKLSYALLAAGIIILAYYISANWYQVSLIHGDSMYPAYHNLQVVLIDRHSGGYTYDDVVVFTCDGLDAVLVKRIAACPGDRVTIREGTLYVNDTISSVFAREHMFAYAGTAGKVISLGEGEYFVIGDNVEESRDSRYAQVGCVAESSMIGRVIPHMG